MATKTSIPWACDTLIPVKLVYVPSTTIYNLPNEVLDMIASNLPKPTLLSLASVNRHFHNISLRHLYRSISVPTATKLLQLVSTLSLHSYLTTYIQSLSMTFAYIASYLTNSHEEETRKNVDGLLSGELIGNLLGRCVNLRRVEFRNGAGCYTTDKGRDREGEELQSWWEKALSPAGGLERLTEMSFWDSQIDFSTLPPLPTLKTLHFSSNCTLHSLPLYVFPSLQGVITHPIATSDDVSNDEEEEEVDLETQLSWEVLPEFATRSSMPKFTLEGLAAYLEEEYDKDAILKAIVDLSDPDMEYCPRSSHQASGSLRHLHVYCLLSFLTTDSHIDNFISIISSQTFSSLKVTYVTNEILDPTYSFVTQFNKGGRNPEVEVLHYPDGTRVTFWAWGEEWDTEEVPGRGYIGRKQ